MIPHNIRILKKIEPTNLLVCDDNECLQIMTNRTTENKNMINYDKVNGAILKSFDHTVLMGEMYRDLTTLELPMSGLLLLIRNYYLLKVPQTRIDELINIYYKVKNDIESIQTKYGIVPITVLVPDVITNFKSKKKVRFPIISNILTIIKEKLQKLWNMIKNRKKSNIPHEPFDV